MAEHGPLVDVPYSGDDLAHWVERETAQRGRTRGSATIRHLVESLSRERSAREASERALEEARKDAGRLDKLDALIVESCGRKFGLGPDAKEGHASVETWGASEIRELLDATEAPEWFTNDDHSTESVPHVER